MKIALGQFNVIAGDKRANVASMEKMIREAAISGHDLIVFSEMCVGGYMLGDLYLDDDYCLDLMRENYRIAGFALQYGIAVAYGNVYLEEDINERLPAALRGWHPNKDGRRRRYNAVYVYDNKGRKVPRMNDNYLPRGVAIKTNLPNYRIFDDERYFFSMFDHCLDFNIAFKSAYNPFLINGKKIGFALCEDLWCEDYRISGNSQNPTKYLTMAGAEMVCNLSASPWTYGKNGARDRRVMYVQNDIKSIGRTPVPMCYVNCVSVQNNGKNIVTFDGGSTVYDSDGDIVALAKKPYHEEILSIDVNNLPAKKSRPQGCKVAEKHLAIQTALRSMFKCKVVLGLSGGIDSAVDTALFVDALGADNVITVNMPTRYNSQLTKDNARLCAEALGVKYYVIPIEALADQKRETIKSYLAMRDGKLTSQVEVPQIVDENLQAKVRAIDILSNIAQIENGIYICNGNKVELAIGYFTLDADGRGAIAPIGDLTKEEVYEMGKYLNEDVFKKQVIPQGAFDVVPSAELKDNQRDPIKVGYHCRIIEKMTNYHIASATTFMKWWLEGTLHTNLGLTVNDLFAHGAVQGDTFVEDLKFILRRERNQVFKRVQGVPIIITSKTAYGYDRRESILPPYQFTEEAEMLAAKIVAKREYSPKEPIA